MKLEHFLLYTLQTVSSVVDISALSAWPFLGHANSYYLKNPSDSWHNLSYPPSDKLTVTWLSVYNLDWCKNFHSPPKLGSSTFFLVITLDLIQSEYQARRYLPHPGPVSVQLLYPKGWKADSSSHQWWPKVAVQAGKAQGSCEPRALQLCNIHSETEDKPSSVTLLEKHRNLQGCDNVAAHSRQVSLYTEHFEAQLFKETRTYSDPSYSVHQQWNYWSAWNCCRVVRTNNVDQSCIMNHG